MLGTILIFNKSPRMLGALAATALVLSACAGSGVGERDEPIQIVATTAIAGDLIAQVAGGAAGVTVLMPIGTDPHDFQPSSQQVASLRSADLVVAWGLGLEDTLLDILQTAAADGVPVLELSPLLDPIEFGTSIETEQENALDPHTWTDPVRMADAARIFGDRLTEIAPEGDWSERAEAVAATMMDVHAQVTDILSVIPDERRRLVTNHDSFGYFAARYGFDVVGVAIPGGSTLTSPSAAQIAELVRAIETAGVDVLFAESTSSPAILEAVAEEVGSVRVVELLEGSLAPQGEPGDTLVGMLLRNAELIAEALG